MASPPKKRITMKLKNPNPLFEKWLIEWRDKAKEEDSKMQRCFSKALHFLRMYPLPLKSGRDCILLKGFGEKLCQMLDDKLAQHNQMASCSEDTSQAEQSDIKKRLSGRKKLNNIVSKDTKSKDYTPRWRTGAFAILLTLYETSLKPKYPGYMLKKDIIKHGQHLCDKSFIKPDAGSYYSGWSSMKTLLDKNLVTKNGSPAQFSLTDTGVMLAYKLYQEYVNNKQEDNQFEPNNFDIKSSTVVTSKVKDIEESTSSSESSESEIQSTSSTDASQEETFTFTPGSFEIILLVDTKEVAGNTRSPADDFTLTGLTNLKVNYEVKHLKVGDYTWICRHLPTSRELVLPYIIERKRMDDFGSSIKDGRYHEQKFRLKQCGLENLVYLIESYGDNSFTGLPLATLYQAATNTLLQDNFSVKFTEGPQETVYYLASFTTILKQMYENKTLVNCLKKDPSLSAPKDDLVPLMSFREFNKTASKTKNFKVQELFVRQLLQLKGMSVEKALAITEKYPTPSLLWAAYANSTSSDGEKLLSKVQYGKLGKNVGLVISKAVYQLYTNEKF